MYLLYWQADSLSLRHLGSPEVMARRYLLDTIEMKIVAPPSMGFSVHGTLQARMLEWVAISFSRGSSLTQGSNPCFLPCQVDSLPLCHLGSPLQRNSPNTGWYLSMTSDLIHPVSSSWVQTQDWLRGCQDFARVSLDSSFPVDCFYTKRMTWEEEQKFWDHKDLGLSPTTD